MKELLKWLFPPAKKEEPLVWKEVKEKSRTYHFPGGETLTLHTVRRICVRPSGNHRVEGDVDGKKLNAIVSPTWSYIVVELEDGADWTF